MESQHVQNLFVMTISLTPALSPRRGRNVRRDFGKLGDGIRRMIMRESKNLQTRLLLLRGEDWCKGESKAGKPSSQTQPDLLPKRLAGFRASAFPICKRSQTDAKFGCQLFMFKACSLAIFSQHFSKLLTIFARWRIHPYGLDHQMAKRVQKPPLPPVFLILIVRFNAENKKRDLYHTFSFD